jgi:hypothetical protein
MPMSKVEDELNKIVFPLPKILKQVTNMRQLKKWKI